MSSRTPVLMRTGSGALPARLPRLSRERVDTPPEQRVLASWILTMVAACVAVLLLNLVVVSQFQHYIAQRHLYSEFRQGLAEGSLPLGQTSLQGDLTEAGSPIARIGIPSIGVDEIVVEGSTSYQTMDGIGHRRDTPLPGQAGVAVLLGRAAAYGGIFRRLDELRAGDPITVLTQQGTSTYEVIGVRSAKTMLPVLGPDDGRLTLATASGLSYRPIGVQRVDATLVSTAFGRPAPVVSSASLSDSEQALAGDQSHAFALTWLLLLLVLVLAAAVWTWLNWSKRATWLVFAPIVTMIGLAVASAVCGMLPNLI